MSMIRIKIQPEMVFGVASTFLAFYEDRANGVGDVSLDIAEAKYRGAVIGASPILRCMAPDVEYKDGWGMELVRIATEVSKLSQDHGVKVLHIGGQLADFINEAQALADAKAKL